MKSKLLIFQIKVPNINKIIIKISYRLYKNKFNCKIILKTNLLQKINNFKIYITITIYIL